MKTPAVRTGGSSPIPAPLSTNVPGKVWTPPARRMGWMITLVLLGLVFGKPLFALAGFAARTYLFSYILCIPFCSAALLYLRRSELPHRYVCSPMWALFAFVPGLMAWLTAANWRASSQVDHLALLSFSFVCLLMAAGFLFHGRHWMAAAAFPAAFLFFITPLPDGVLEWLEVHLQSASAEAASLLFSISGTPVSRDGFVFDMPGFSIEVGKECSGIQATWVLFVSTVLASSLCLKSPWRRTALILAVIPLGILRNGFRIVTIGLLCVHWGPQMIDSPIHRKGGPYFLLLSLIPLSIFLWWLRRGEARRANSRPE